MNCPSHFSLALDLKSLSNTLELSNGTRTSHRVLKVFRVRGDGDTPGFRIPNDWSLLRRTQCVPHACCGSLKRHAERGNTRQVHVRNDAMSCIALLRRPRRSGEELGIPNCGRWLRAWLTSGELFAIFSLVVVNRSRVGRGA